MNTTRRCGQAFGPAWGGCTAVFAAAALACSSTNGAGNGPPTGSLDAGSPTGTTSDASTGATPQPDGSLPPSEAGTGGTPGYDGGPAPPSPEAGIDAGPPPSCPVGPSGTISIAAGAGAGSGAAATITLDGAGTGRTFDGIGAISGGGGNSRLLLDYPEPARTQILDYLFKPGYGAALQILKVEIGGDTNSTDGAESSHMHTANDLSCSRGYEWWLMKEAKARNPNIKLYGLQWGAPGWIGGGNFWSDDMVSYLESWLDCAKMNGLSIDYLGGHNEDGYDKGWFEKLHTALASKGYGVKLVCADQSDWGVGADIAGDSAFKAACDLVGVHYPCGGDGAPATSCPGDSASMGLGIPLWASENGSQDYNTGSPAMARAINRGYLDAKMTAFLNWPLVAALAPNLPFPTTGLLVSSQPWSGYYDVGSSLWVTGHTTQFTQPGWTYIDSASGYLGSKGANGSYVTLKAPAGGDYSVVIETADAQSPQTLAFTVQGGLSTSAAHVWSTDLGSTKSADHFVHATDVTPTGGAFWVTLAPNTITTISTTTGQCKSAATSPPAAPLKLPYAENFDSYANGSLPRWIGDQEGAFEIAPCGAGRSGGCYRQMDPVVPIPWLSTPGNAWTLVGDGAWADYAISADVLLESAGSVELLGRFAGRDYWTIDHFDAYFVSVPDNGAWAIGRNTSNNGPTTLASGYGIALGTNTWHTVTFDLRGTTLKATVDGMDLGTATAPSDGPTTGPAGLSVGLQANAWLDAQFDNLKVTP